MEKFDAAQSLLGVDPLPQSLELLFSSDQTWVTWCYQKGETNPTSIKCSTSCAQRHLENPRKTSGVFPGSMLAMPRFAIGNNSCLPPA